MFHTFVGATAGDENKAYLRPETAQGIFLNFKNVLDSSRVRVPFGIAQIGKAFRNEVTPRNFIFRSPRIRTDGNGMVLPPERSQDVARFLVHRASEILAQHRPASDNMQMRDHDQGRALALRERRPTARRTSNTASPSLRRDIGELEGIAHRCDFDLTQHQEHSGQSWNIWTR
jgi:glycyl-tRNA synthetase